MVAAGTYKPTVEVEVDHAISVGGTPARPFPSSRSPTTSSARTTPPRSSTTCESKSSKKRFPTRSPTKRGRVERVYAYSFDSAGACEIASGTLRDSVCWGGLVAVGSAAGSVHIVLRNVTATSTVMGASSGSDVTIDGANLIMHSIDPKQSNGADLAVDVNVGASASISLTHSNYATVDSG